MDQDFEYLWNVESVEDFLYYCCPACDDRKQSRDDFLHHAFSKHPIAKKYLVEVNVKNEFDDDTFDFIDTKDNLNVVSDVADEHNLSSNIIPEDLEREDKNDLQLKEENISEELFDDHYDNDDKYFDQDNNSVDFKEDDKVLSDENEVNDLALYNILKECENCGKQFVSASSLRKHIMKVHKGTKPFKCKHCDKSYFSKINLKHHEIRNHTSGKLKFQCDFNACEKSFDNVIELKEHKQNDHVGDKMNHNCKYCGKGYNNERLFKIHINSKHENIRFPCTICGKDFTLNKSLKQHIKNTHDQIKDYICKEIGCGKAYSTAAELKMHVNRSHNSLRVICDTCGQTFVDKYTLKNHITKVHVHGHGKRKYKCDFEECSESFDKQPELKKHKLNDHVGDKTKYQCDECEKGYNKESNLLAHIDKVHKGITEMCFLCGRKLSSKNSLRTHMKTHEKDADKEEDDITPHTIQFYPDSEYEDISQGPNLPNSMPRSQKWNYFLYNPKTKETKCRFCGLKNMIPQCMIGHLRVKHKIIVESIVRDLDPERLRCKECGKMFKNLQTLRDHINTHTGNRPYACDTCGKTFANKANRRAHIRQSHLGKKRNYNNRKPSIKLEMSNPI